MKGHTIPRVYNGIFWILILSYFNIAFLVTFIVVRSCTIRLLFVSLLYDRIEFLGSVLRYIRDARGRSKWKDRWKVRCSARLCAYACHGGLRRQAFAYPPGVKADYSGWCHVRIISKVSYTVLSTVRCHIGCFMRRTQTQSPSKYETLLRVETL